MQRGILLILIAAVLWGTTGVSAQYINDIYPLSPLTIGAWRLIFASPVLVFISYLNKSSQEPVKKNINIWVYFSYTAWP